MPRHWEIPHLMNSKGTDMKSEPAVTVATVTATVTALLALLTAFGLSLSADQTAAILGVVGVVAPLVAGLVIRSKVVPVAAPTKDA